jgi:exopolysaccharide production protein ExoQ
MFFNSPQKINRALLFAALGASNLTVLAGIYWIAPVFVYISAALWLALGAISLALMGRYRLLGDFGARLRDNWHLLPFMLFAAFSIFWSISPDISLARWLVLLGAVLTGAYLGLRLTLREFVRDLSVFAVIFLLASAVFVVFFPQTGVMNYFSIQGAWKGIFWHKNHMGILTAFASLLFLFNLLGAYRARERSFWFWLGLYAFSLFFLYKTDSVGSWLTLLVSHAVFGAGLAYLYFRARLRRAHYLFFALVGLGLVALALLNLETIFQLFGRNASLTGRVPMWQYVYETYFLERAWHGYGFNAFWYIYDHRADIGAAARYPDPIIIADNGFWDILINTGYIGLGLFLLFYAVAWWKTIQFTRRVSTFWGLFPLVFMTYLLFANTSWTLLFENEHFAMLILLVLLFAFPNGD